MNAVEDQVRELVEVEMSELPQFRSTHDGWAVIQKELEEAKESLCSVEMTLEQAWGAIKDNRPARFELVLAGLAAQNAACEAIQVAAMCRKFMEMGGDKP